MAQSQSHQSTKDSESQHTTLHDNDRSNNSSALTNTSDTVPGKGAVLIAISGPSCSGKTTLARLLRDTISGGSSTSGTGDSSSTSASSTTTAATRQTCMIVHQDDFYVTDALVPIKHIGSGDGQEKREVQDWDCREAIDFDLFADMLLHVKRTGKTRDGFESKEDTNAIGHVDINWESIKPMREQLRDSVARFAARTGKRVVIVDGLLLFAQGLEKVSGLFDVRLLLTIEHATLKRRRDARKGYVTLEGFWEDPPGYVDDVVWPNYVKDHQFLYRNHDIDAGIDAELCRSLEIYDRPKSLVEDMNGCFTWAARLIIEHLEKQNHSQAS